MRLAHRLAIVSVLPALLAAVVSPAAAAPRGSNAIACRDDTPDARRLKMRVEGEVATGNYALPSGEPAGLVVVAHGYGHTSYSWVRHMRAMANHGLIAVAMNYRGLRILPDDDGDGLPGSRGLPIMDGAEDLIAAAKLFEALCEPPTVALTAVSGGASQSGIALAEAGERGLTASDGGPLFDYWIDIEGLVNLVETYFEARLVENSGNAFARNAREDIEKEAGGPFEEDPQAYLDRTVVARADDVAASGLLGAIAIHGVDDGLVPYNQSREITAELRLLGVPTEMVTVGLKDEDSERETTLTGYVGGALDPNYSSPLAGHSSEKSTTHIVMETALERLWQLFEGRTPANRECAANGVVPVRVVCTP
jgi:hypothetical protein